jgi:23S rRNA (cytosine1962-C5)-methyltransferase
VLPLLELLARIAPGLDSRALAGDLRAGRAGGLRARSERGRPLRDPADPVAPGAAIEWTDPPAAVRAALAAAEAGLDASRDGSAAGAWLALALDPPWSEGALAAASRPDLPRVRFERLDRRDGVALLSLAGLPRGGDALDARTLCQLLGEAGMPVVGDARHGGALVRDGLRLRRASESTLNSAGQNAVSDEEDWWPTEPLFAPDATTPGPGGESAVLTVSQASLRALERGHPWVLTDTETGDAGRFRPGALVWLALSQKAPTPTPPAQKASRVPGRPLARIEGPGVLAARVWARRAARTREAPSVEARVARALERRAALLAPAPGVPATDAFRLIHGEADGLPGLAIDRLGPLLRVLVTGRASEGFADRVIDAVVGALTPALGAEPAVLRVVHLRDRPAGALRAVEWLRGKLPPDALASDGRLRVRERGLSFWVEPGLARPEQPSPGAGLFLDQRENRERLARLARRGGRWLNLFAHTGAFSAALLAGGAAEVWSVDLSAAWLRWLDENLALNGLADARHRGMKGDGRRVLERLDPELRFDGIVLDPPTAAAAGRKFWSVRRDLPVLVEAALARLAPGGALLVSRNDRGSRGGLDALVAAAAQQAGSVLAGIEPAGPGVDFPSLAGFPEGDPFEGVIAHRGGGRSPRPGSLHAGRGATRR